MYTQLNGGSQVGVAVQCLNHLSRRADVMEETANRGAVYRRAFSLASPAGRARMPGAPVVRIAGAGLVNLSQPCWADTQVGLRTSWATGWQPHLQSRKRIKQSRWRRTSRIA